MNKELQNIDETEQTDILADITPDRYKRILHIIKMVVKGSFTGFLNRIRVVAPRRYTALKKLSSTMKITTETNEGMMMISQAKGWAEC